MKSTENTSNGTTRVQRPDANGTQPQPLVWDVHSAARRLSVSPVTVRKLVRGKRLARLPQIRKLLISEMELQRFAATTG